MALHKLRCLLLVVTLPLLLIASQVQLAAAQGPQEEVTGSVSALAVSPAIMEEVLTPGEPVNFKVNVQNATNIPLPIKSFVRNLTVMSAELEKTDQDRLDASRWFAVSEPDFILQPNQVRTVEGSITPPADAPPGGHYATIYFQPLVPEEALSPSMAYVNSRVGVLAFLVVKGEIEQKAELDQPLHAASLIRSGPAEFTFSIHNTGNVHLVPKGKLTIYDWRGKQAATLDLPDGIILPNSTKPYAMQWEPPGLVGKYRAELSVTYGNEHVALQKTSVSVWVMPWIEIIGFVVVLAVIIFLTRRVKRRWRKVWRAYRG